jgi:hypothetical protein
MARDGLAELVTARPLVSALAAADPGIGEDGDHLPAMALGDCRKFAAGSRLSAVETRRLEGNGHSSRVGL